MSYPGERTPMLLMLLMIFAPRLLGGKAHA